jgi:hypothetical protein
MHSLRCPKSPRRAAKTPVLGRRALADSRENPANNAICASHGVGEYRPSGRVVLLSAVDVWRECSGSSRVYRHSTGCVVVS